MAKKKISQSRFVNGISDFQKEGGTDTYYFGRGDHRSDPRSFKLSKKAIKESGSVIEDLPKWAEITPCGEILFYGDTGKIYKRDANGVYTKLRQAPNSHGNGMSYFGEDNFIYYTTDKVIGRYGPVCGTSPQFSDDFLGSQGGVPLNTNSLWLDAASSMYAYRADTASLSITGDLSIEAQIHPLSLPTTGTSQTFVSKWNENGNIRSYKFDITTQSNYFGDGSDGALTISADTTDTPIDSACSGTVGATALTATNVSFAAGQIIYIHQSQVTGAGTYQRNKIVSYTAGTISLDQPLNATYTTGAQVLVIKQYTDVTVNSGKTWSAKLWNGTTGGILIFLANGAVTVTGTISASGKGYNLGGKGRTGQLPTVIKQTGEGNLGYVQQIDYSGCSYGNSNNYGSGGGYGANCQQEGGGGGGNGAIGSNGIYADLSGNITPTAGKGGEATGTADLTTMLFGGQGGGGSSGYAATGGNGGNGGGILFISGTNITITGSVVSNGNNGGNGDNTGGYAQGGGGGAGGSILLKSQVGILGASLVSAQGGGGGNDGSGNLRGGSGAVGRINLNYYTSYTGTTTPTLNVVQDSSLGAADGYVLRLSLSSNGTAVTTFSKTFIPVLNNWQHVAVSFDSARTLDATKCYCEFFYNGVTLGATESATLTISDNASEFFVGAYKNATVATGFYDGYIDEVRVWNTVKTADDYISMMSAQVLTTLPYLQGYWKFNGDLTDATANANALTGSGSPTYVTDVPFPSPTTRLDIDQTATTTGNTYTTPTTISEAATARKTFTPEKDPQKSVAVLVAAKGTGDWTLTIHDQYNNEIASSTIVNAQLAVGYNEFVFTTPWRPLLNANYHFHITSTVANGTVTTTTASDLTTVSFRTYFQFLVEDTSFHPVAKMLQFLVFGNERYVGTYEATLYDPNYITLPAGYKVRCFGYYKEYLAIGTTKGSSITEQDAGRIYFWDGIASTYNFYVDVPEGGINALLGAKGKLYVWAGYQGDLLVYSGGDTTEQIKRVPLLEDTKYLEVYPGAVTMYRMLIRFGVAGGGDTESVQRGTYTWGSQNVRYTDSLSYDYVLSTGTVSSNAKIGLVMVFNKRLIIGYQDNVSYGIDYVDASNDPQSTGEIQLLLTDHDVMWKEKEILQIVANFEPLKTGESVNVKYKLDRADNWTYLGAVTTAGETIARLVVGTGGSRYHEIQYGVDLATSVTTTPKLLALSIEVEPLTTEERFG